LTIPARQNVPVGAIPAPLWPRPLKGKLIARLVATDSENIQLNVGNQRSTDPNVAVGALCSVVWFVVYLTVKLSGARWGMAFCLAVLLAAATWAAITFGPRLASKDKNQPDATTGDVSASAAPAGGTPGEQDSTAATRDSSILPDHRNNEAATDVDLASTSTEPPADPEPPSTEPPADPEGPSAEPPADPGK
jgi:hypothetical protein